MKFKSFIISAISIILVCAMATTILSTAVFTITVGGLPAYSDVAESDWFYENVKFVTEQGLMNGVAD
ncbi:MAG: S-layer homology domain-containing protein, partial [Clostridia bacterium]|nr:S-layer homology domain-containing protein [Clostridia bacterium]